MARDLPLITGSMSAAGPSLPSLSTVGGRAMSDERQEQRIAQRNADRRFKIDLDRRRWIDHYRERGFAPERIARFVGLPVADIEAHIAYASSDP